MSEGYLPLAPTGAVPPPGEAVHRSENDPRREQKRQLFQQALKKKGAPREEPAAEEKREDDDHPGRRHPDKAGTKADAPEMESMAGGTGDLVEVESEAVGCGDRAGIPRAIFEDSRGVAGCGSRELFAERCCESQDPCGHADARPSGARGAPIMGDHAEPCAPVILAETADREVGGGLEGGVGAEDREGEYLAKELPGYDLESTEMCR